MSGMSFSEWVHKKHLDEEVGPHCVKEGDRVRLLVSAATAEKHLAMYNDDPAGAAQAIVSGECVVTSTDDHLLVVQKEDHHITVPRKIVRKV